MYTYPALLRSPDDVYDGDTLRLDVDCGFGIWKHREAFRLFGIDTPEIRGGTNDTRLAGQLARARLIELIEEHGEFWGGEGTLLTIRTFKDEQEKYGRFLCEILTRDESDTLNRLLIIEGHAKPYLQ